MPLFIERDTVNSFLICGLTDDWPSAHTLKSTNSGAGGSKEACATGLQDS